MVGPVPGRPGPQPSTSFPNPGCLVLPLAKPQAGSAAQRGEQCVYFPPCSPGMQQERAACPEEALSPSLSPLLPLLPSSRPPHHEAPSSTSLPGQPRGPCGSTWVFYPCTRGGEAQAGGLCSEGIMVQAAAGGKEVKAWRGEERGREDRHLSREGFGGRVGGVLGAPDGQAEEGGQEPPWGKARGRKGPGASLGGQGPSREEEAPAGGCPAAQQKGDCVGASRSPLLSGWDVLREGGGRASGA